MIRLTTPIPEDQIRQIKVGGEVLHGLLREVANEVQKVCPEADLRLYGSRARGDAAPDSDWDILVLVPDLALKPSIRDALLDLELRSGEVIAPLILERSTWLAMEGHPLQREIARDGVAL